MAGVKRGRAGSRAVPLLAQRAASEGPRWTRALWPSPTACPKRTTGHKRERDEEKTKSQRHPSSHAGQIGGDKKTGADRGAGPSRVLAEPPQ